MPTEITSPRNPIVQAARRLHRSHERKSKARFLIEGTHLLQEAVATHWPIETVFCTKSWLAKNTMRLEQSFTVSDEVLACIATTEHPDGVVAVAKHEDSTTKPLVSFKLGIIAENLQSPDNLGSLIRSSAAANVDGLWLIEPSVDSTNPKVLRSSAGQWFRLPPQRTASIAAVRDAIPKRDLQILGAAAEGKNYWEIDFTRPTLFVLGNEGAGLTVEARSSVDGLVSLPMAPNIESLNVAVAGALLLYEAKRQRHGLKPATKFQSE